MLHRIVKTKYFVIFNFLIAAVITYYGILEVTRALVLNFGPDNFMGSFELAFNLGVIFFALAIMLLIGISLWGMRISKANKNRDLQTGFYITAILSLLALIAFGIILIFRI